MKKSLIALLILLVAGAVIYAAETAILNSGWVERRNQEPLIKPVWEFKVTGSFNATDEGNATQAIAVNGIILKVILIVPANTQNGPDCEVEILDNANIKIFDSTDLAVGTHTFNIYEPVTGTIDVVMGPASAFGTTNGVVGGDIIVYLRGI